MTLWGKILVVINWLMSLIFMGFAVAVHVAREDLVDKYKKEQAKVQTELKNLSDMKAQKAAVEKLRDDALAEVKAQKEKAENAEKQRLADVERVEKERDAAKKESAESLAQMNSATIEQTQRRGEVDKLRASREEMLKKNTELVIERTNLQDELAQLKSQYEQGQVRNQQLAERIQQLEGYVVSFKGSVPTPEELARGGQGNTPPPEIEGIVTKVDPTGRFVQISIGEDDGIRRGQTLEVWRTKPEPKYLGQVKIFTTEATTAVAKPVSVSGLIQNNDRVGPKILMHTAN